MTHPRFLRRALSIIAGLAVTLGFLVANPLSGAVAAETATTSTLKKVATKATYVSKSSPKKAYGKKSTIRASKSSYAAYLEFAPVKLAPGESITSVSLQLHVKSLTGKKQAKVKITPVKKGWSATKLTYQKRPKVISGKASVTKTVKTGKTVSIPLDPALLAGGASFRITNALSGSSIKITAKGSKAPRLSIKTQTVKAKVKAPAPQPSPTASAPAKPPSTNSASDKKLVFAHYFPPYPISIDNKEPSVDYYARHYLQASGENGKFADIGGLLRDRPVARAPLSGNWQLTDMKTDIRNAINAGIDGFAVDILSLSGANWDRTILLLEAAHQVSPSFKIMLQPDMTTGAGSASAASLAAALAKLAAYPSAYRLGDGRVVISPFKAEAKTPAQWSEVLKLMQSKHQVKTAFLPLFLDAGKMSSYASISYGFGNWGVRDPKAISSWTNWASKAHALDRLWMQPVSVQDVRPNQKIYDEAGNTEALRASWDRAISDKADLVLLVTWNDYSESTSFAPSDDHGLTFLDISKYYLTEFKTGSRPTITTDRIHLTHRIQPHASRPSYSNVMVQRSGPRIAPRDTVEVLTFLTASATVEVTLGGQTHSYTAPKGVSAKLFPLKEGYATATAKRSNNTVATVKTKDAIRTAATQQDLTYHAVSSKG